MPNSSVGPKSSPVDTRDRFTSTKHVTPLLYVDAGKNYDIIRDVCLEFGHNTASCFLFVLFLIPSFVFKNHVIRDMNLKQ